jgi:hypothetical protein
MLPGLPVGICDVSLYLLLALSVIGLDTGCSRAIGVYLLGIYALLVDSEPIVIATGIGLPTRHHPPIASGPDFLGFGGSP